VLRLAGQASDSEISDDRIALRGLWVVVFKVGTRESNTELVNECGLDDPVVRSGQVGEIGSLAKRSHEWVVGRVAAAPGAQGSVRSGERDGLLRDPAPNPVVG